MPAAVCQHRARPYRAAAHHAASLPALAFRAVLLHAEAVQLALDGGATVVQLREKDAEGGAFLEQVGWRCCRGGWVCSRMGQPLLRADTRRCRVAGSGGWQAGPEPQHALIPPPCGQVPGCSSPGCPVSHLAAQRVGMLPAGVWGMGGSGREAVCVRVSSAPSAG